MPFPGGVVVDKTRGEVYVAVWSISNEDGADVGFAQLPPGEVWRLSF